MRLFVSGSAPLFAETHKAFEARTGHLILEPYGMTETKKTTSNPYDGERCACAVGFPVPRVELRISDPETGEELASGEVGQIEVRGPNVFGGYWHMPDKTAEELRADGFFITGDHGTIDPVGYVQIIGSSMDLINSGGYYIYLKEIELLLNALPGAREGAVIGIPHRDLGDAMFGVLVAETGISLNLDHIAVAANASLARFEQPRRLIEVDDLPRNSNGKVQKNVLRETFTLLFR